MRIPYSTEQGIIFAEQGILAREQGILSARIEVFEKMPRLGRTRNRPRGPGGFPNGFSQSPERPYLHYVVMPSSIGVTDLAGGVSIKRDTTRTTIIAEGLRMAVTPRQWRHNRNQYPAVPASFDRYQRRPGAVAGDYAFPPTIGSPAALQRAQPCCLILI